MIAKKFIEGVIDSGVDVLDIGKVATEMLYFAVGNYNLDGGAMVTASHNPKEWNGLKFCKKKGQPFGQIEGMFKMLEIVKHDRFLKSKDKGYYEEKDVYRDYVTHVLRSLKREALKPYKIVVDASNGMAGKVIPKLFRSLPFEIIPLFFDLDGNFPNHSPNPAEIDNLKGLIKKVREERADFGLGLDRKSVV